MHDTEDTRDLFAKGAPHLTARESDSAEHRSPAHLEVLHHLVEVSHELASASWEYDRAAAALADRFKRRREFHELGVDPTRLEKLDETLERVRESVQALGAAMKTAGRVGHGRVS